MVRTCVTQSGSRIQALLNIRIGMLSVIGPTAYAPRFRAFPIIGDTVHTGDAAVIKGMLGTTSRSRILFRSGTSDGTTSNANPVELIITRVANHAIATTARSAMDAACLRCANTKCSNDKKKEEVHYII